MSYQLLCDNCGTAVLIVVKTNNGYFPTLPPNWEHIYGRNNEHLCPECVSAKTQAQYRAREAMRRAEEEALAARRRT